jgi:hypothetical protein
MQTETIAGGPQFSNSRRWPRFAINVPIRAVVQREDRVLIVEGRGNELNEGGLQVFAGVELRVGDSVDIEFTPPYQGLPIRARCMVRNRRGYYYGVEFLNETPDDRKKIASIRQTLQALGSPIH